MPSSEPNSKRMSDSAGCDFLRICEIPGRADAVDQNHSYAVSAYWTALRKRTDGCGVGTDCAEAAATSAARATTAGRFAEVVQAIFYILPPAANGGLCQAISHHIRRSRVIFMLGATLADGTGSSGLWSDRRGESGHKPTPTAAVIDSQSASTTQAGGPRGFDPANGFTGASGTLSPIPTVCCWPSTFIPPMSIPIDQA